MVELGRQLASTSDMEGERELISARINEQVSNHFSARRYDTSRSKQVINNYIQQRQEQILAHRSRKSSIRFENLSTVQKQAEIIGCRLKDISKVMI